MLIKSLTSILLVVLSCSLTLSLSAQEILERKTTSKKIDVGGYELYFLVTPGNSPVIVLEAGGGLDSEEWRAVQELLRINTDNAVVSYDRSGMGKSDLNPEGYSLESEINGLKAGLKSLGYSEDILYVGHSFGGFYLDAYADLYPEELVGLLYIDPNNPEFIASTGGPEQFLEDFDENNYPDTKVGQALIRQTLAMGDIYETVSSIKSKKVPCRVITAGVEWFNEANKNKAWRASHENMAKQCQTKLIIAEGDNHFIPFLNPHLILTSILKIINQDGIHLNNLNHQN